jgi:hypothetical protein
MSTIARALSISTEPSSPSRGKLAAICIVLIILTLLFRLPALVNARDVNSDAAVVGLQAMHILHGEWSRFLWGAGYQSALDSVITAGAFAMFGPGPTVLMLVPIVGHLIVTFLALAILKKRIGLWPAAITVLPLVFTPWAMTSVVIYPPRQWCIVAVFLAIWLLDGASESKRPLLNFALGIFFAAIAVLIDLYAVLFVAGFAALALMCLFDPPSDRVTCRRRAIACCIGIALGTGAICLNQLSAQADVAQAKLSMDRIASNARLLWNECLPFSLGYKWFADSDDPLARALWRVPMPGQIFLVIGGWSLVIGIVAGGAMIFMKRIPWRIRRLGMFGLIVALATIGAFLLSVAPSDFWAARYLGPIFWIAPFALAPIAFWLGRRVFAAMLTPYLIVAAISGWTSYGFRVDEIFPHLTSAGSATQETQLSEFLQARGIHNVAVNYWLAYRLTYLTREQIVAAPLEQFHDRYFPYHQQFLDAKIKAIVFHPLLSDEHEKIERCLRENEIAYQTEHVGEFTVLIFNGDKSFGQWCW